MITANLIEPGEAGLTVSSAWGVGGAVAGEAAATVVLQPDGGVVTVSEAKTPYQRKLADEGGITWVPAADGAVLTADEQAALRQLADEVDRKYTPALNGEGLPRPWDIEFGFVRGDLVLFQIRPLVERGQQLANRVADRLITRNPSAASSHE